MLCKKCKTAVLDSDKVCNYCGTAVKRRDNFWKIYLVASVIVVVMFFSLEKYFFKISGEQTGTDEIIVTPTPEGIPHTAQEEKKHSADSPTDTPGPLFVFDSSRNSVDIEPMIRNICAAAIEYVKRGIGMAYFISQNGYLFDDIMQNYVKPKDLVGIEGFDDKYENEVVLILYLRPSDFLSYGIEPEVTNPLEVFAAYETVDGFFICSGKKYLGVVTRETLSEILNQYSQSHGDIVRYRQNTKEYRGITEAIAKYTKNSGKLDVRYMAGDSKYAYAVVSIERQSDIIKQYALRRDKNTWSVIASDFDEQFEYRAVVNIKYPDFSSGLFPDFNMYFHNKYVTDDFMDVLLYLIDQKYIREEDGNVKFMSGNDEFCYFEFEKGRNLLCYVTAKKVNAVYSITNYVEGENIMRVLSDNPPFFLLIQR